MRRNALLSVVAASTLALVAACGNGSSGSNADGQETIDITVTQWPAGSYTPPYALGMEEGVFADHGIEIGGVLPGAGGGTTVRNLLSGDLAFGEVAFPAAVQAFLQGAPLVIVGGAARTFADGVYVTRPDAPFEDLEDLVGKKVGYTNPGSVTQTVSFLLMESAGIPYNDIKWTAAGGVSEGLTLLEAGELDAHYISEPQHTIEVNEGRWKTLFRMTDYVPALQQTVIVTSPQLIEENPELVRSYLAAYDEAVQAVMKDPENAGAHWARVGEFDEKASSDAAANLAEVNHWSVSPDVEGMNAMLTGMLEGGLLSEDEPVAWDELINQDFLPEGAEVDTSELLLSGSQ